VDHDLVRHREPRSRREDFARVTHRDLITEDLRHTGERGREVDRPEDHHPRGWRERLDERRYSTLACLAVLAVVPDARDARRQLSERVTDDDSIEVRISER